MARSGSIEQSIALDGCEADVDLGFSNYKIDRTQLISGMTGFVRMERGCKVYLEGTFDAEELLALFMALSED